MVIYTKKGDRGETSLYDASSAQRKRVSKSSARIRAIGCVDELNSYLGVVITQSEDTDLMRLLREIQADLLIIGSILAGSNLRMSNSKAVKMEKIIDRIEGNLPVLKNFILPGGNAVAAHLHYSRSLARRTERAIVFLNEKEEIKPQILVYINRLSDLLFMLARNANFKNNKPEKIWIGRKLK